MDKLKARLGFGANWDAEYLQEDDSPHTAEDVTMMASQNDYASEAAARNAYSGVSKKSKTPSAGVAAGAEGRRYAKDSPYASGAAPSAVTKHVRKPDLKRVSEITGREIRETTEGRRSAQPRIEADGSTTFKPKDFSEAILVANHLKEGKVVIVDLSLVPSLQRQRFVDFMAGLVYALEGHLARSSAHVYTLRPR
ncbi:MAG: cell division protein SepF [Coriobacteriia bacterium]|nr:cell division protein SepF [Coriobacteriia bacterium]MCL2746325.1 cell division protein SepF [Coriobacteriia bacterium]MCL2870942.1 cell division protein SepF [Coriobacteriia bacterium]